MSLRELKSANFDVRSTHGIGSGFSGTEPNCDHLWYNVLLINPQSFYIVNFLK
jgi:hypothetical protein